MIQSKAVTVDHYMAEIPTEHVQVLTRLRTLALQVLAGYTEQMRWGMPVYSRNGKAEFAFANQKQYLALYFMKKDVHVKNSKILSKYDTGKGCIRFKRRDKMDFSLIAQLLQDTIESDMPPC